MKHARGNTSCAARTVLIRRKFHLWTIVVPALREALVRDTLVDGERGNTLAGVLHQNKGNKLLLNFFRRYSCLGFHICPSVSSSNHLVRRERNAFDEPLGDADESRLGPRKEPVYGGAVDEGREITAPDAQGVAHGGHAEDDVEVLAHACDEGGEAGVPGLRDAEFLANRDHVGRHLVLLMSIFRRQV